MKHLLTLAALLVSTLSLAQFTPYNPDADNDQFVGAQDLLAFLPLFGEDWDLDSLNIYAVSELQSPDWCLGCYDLVQIPQDADVIFQDTNSNWPLWIMPEFPKPMIFFGTKADYYYDSLNHWGIEDYPGTPENIIIYQPSETPNAIAFCLPFNGEWFIK